MRAKVTHSRAVGVSPGGSQPPNMHSAPAAARCAQAVRGIGVMRGLKSAPRLSSRTR